MTIKYKFKFIYHSESSQCMRSRGLFRFVVGLRGLPSLGATRIKCVQLCCWNLGRKITDDSSKKTKKEEV